MMTAGRDYMVRTLDTRLAGKRKRESLMTGATTFGTQEQLTPRRRAVIAYDTQRILENDLAKDQK